MHLYSYDLSLYQSPWALAHLYSLSPLDHICEVVLFVVRPVVLGLPVDGERVVVVDRVADEGAPV